LHPPFQIKERTHKAAKKKFHFTGSDEIGFKLSSILDEVPCYSVQVPQQRPCKNHRFLPSFCINHA
jgi:hypothetical protein